MDLKEKLSILADAAKYDASCASSGVKRKTPEGGIGNLQGSGICHSYTPDGRCVSLLKILLTNFCIFDCSYCVNRVSSGVKRARFSVDEVVNLTMDFYQRNYIEGLFLSSGVLKSPDETMEEMIAIAKKLRVERRFGGYIHLKAVAGCSDSLLRKAGLYADRLSANIELPKQAELDQLAPAKKHLEIENSMDSIKEFILESKEEKLNFAPGGQSTQMIVGATPSSDREIMQKASDLYQKHELKRVYYSAFSPIPDADSSLPLITPPLIREHRLYQTDWLIRFYGFDVNEILPPEHESLNLELDPKLQWALRHREFFPVDLNLAPKEVLMRIPGIGLKNVERILQTRKLRKIRTQDLIQMRVNLKKVKYFVITADDLLETKSLDLLQAELFKPKPQEIQLELFDAGLSAITGDIS